MADTLEITRDIVIKMIEHGVFDNESLTAQKRDELVTGQICRAFGTVFETVVAVEDDRPSFMQSLYRPQDQT